MLLRTRRLELRPFGLEDLEEFAALHADPEVTRFVRPLDRAEAEQRLRRDEQEWRDRGHGLLAMIESGSGRFLGRTGLKHCPQFDETELGWSYAATPGATDMRPRRRTPVSSGASPSSPSPT